MPRRPMRSFDEFCIYLKSRGFLPETVIDAGVCYGTPELLDNFPDAYHILVEPVPALEPRLQQILRRRRGEYHLCALADRNGEMRLKVPPAGVEGASLIPAGVEAGHTIVVPVRRLDGLIAPGSLAGPVLMKTDCQGFELAAMKGAVGHLGQIEVVVMECNLFHPAGNPDLPDFGEVVGWMRGQGLSLYDIVSYQTRPFDDALGYFDAVFVHDGGPFRRHHRWA